VLYETKGALTVVPEDGSGTARQDLLAAGLKDAAGHAGTEGGRLPQRQVDVDRAGVAAPGEVAGQGEGPAGLRAGDAFLGWGAQEPDGCLGVWAGGHAAGPG
jgi:hypothetical protein